MTQARHLAVAGAVVVLLALGGCSSSPKQELITSADQKCDTISQRFAGDLSFGEDFGGDDDYRKMTERVALIRDLRDHVRGLPAPESGQDELRDWLDKLEAFAAESERLRNFSENAPRGADLYIAAGTNVVDNAAKDTGTAAQRFGFASCARVDRWVFFPGKGS